jgi:K+-sensing histidine kinase KdpD
MAQALVEQARELNALVNNLLEMARLQSGAVNLRMDWQSVEEVVGSAIRSARPALGNQAVQTRLPADLPLVEFDAVLIERVLVNLLENAAKYGAPPIVIGAHVTPDSLVITVSDHGPGLPPRSRDANMNCSRNSRAASPNPSSPASGWVWPSARPWSTRTAAASVPPIRRRVAQNS